MKNDTKNSTDDILNEILGIETYEDKVDEIVFPSPIKIGVGAIKKAYKICEFVKDVHKRSIEWYGLMISKKDEPDVVRNVVIGSQQSSDAHTAMKGDEIGKLIYNIEKEFGEDWIVNGWIHSHANFSTFFSGTDDRNMETVLNSVYRNTRKGFKEAFKAIEGRRNAVYDKNKKEIIISGSLDTDAQIVFPVDEFNLESLTEEQIKKVIKLKIRKPVLVGWSYSIVVNDKSDKKGHINYKKEFPFEEKSENWDEDAEVDILEGKDYELEIDEDKLHSEVESKIKKPIEIIQTIKQRIRIPFTSYTGIGYTGGSYPIGFEPEIEVQPKYAKNVEETDETKEVFIDDTLKFLAEVIGLFNPNSSCFLTPHDKARIYKVISDATKKGLELNETPTSYKGWLEDRLETRLDTIKETVCQLVIDRAVVNTLTDYANKNNKFAKLIMDFTGAKWRKINAFDNYVNSVEEDDEKK